MQDTGRLFGFHFAFSNEAVLRRVQGVLVEVGQGDLDAGEIGLGQVVAGADADVEMMAFAHVVAEPGKGVVGHGACPGVGRHDPEHPPVVDDKKPRLAVNGRSTGAGFRCRSLGRRFGPDGAVSHGRGGGGSLGESGCSGHDRCAVPEVKGK